MHFVLLDNNLSPKLPLLLKGVYPYLHHVAGVGLGSESDLRIWNYVKSRAGAIVTKDADFLHLLSLFGHPPKVIWLRVGNVTTQHIANVLTTKASTVQLFLDDPILGLLELY